MNYGVFARWHSIPVIAVVLVVGGFLAIFAVDDGLVPTIIGSMFILVGGNFAGFYTGFTASQRAESRKQKRL
jgi:hypothetical protein